MANGVDAVSFDEIIQADRQRRKNEALAKEIFGRGRKANTTHNGSRRSTTGGSLASRVGIAKASQRSHSNTPKPRPDVDGTWAHELHRTSNARAPRVTRPARDNPMNRLAKDDLLYNAITTKTISGQVPRQSIAEDATQEINIRGLAGPYTVIGSNFAPGTTAADIESAMAPSGGEMQSCRVVTAGPTVVAEMVFIEKHNAENVISTFNNKKADGRILHVYMKPAGPTAITGVSPIPKAPTAPRAPPIDLTSTEDPSFQDSQREQSDRNRRRAEPTYQDGSFGFQATEDQMEVDTDAAVTSLERRRDRDDRRETIRTDRDERRDVRYQALRDGGRGRYYDRERDLGRPRDDRRLYSDRMYPHPPGRGFR